MTVIIPFDNTYAQLPDQFFTRLNPTAVKAPQLIRFNTDLAAELGISGGDTEDMAMIFSGNTLPHKAEPLAQAYAGHQFGGFSAQLGDGRANLLGEVIDTNGQRRDIQLKGSGPTPYSRMGDGRAWLGPVLREYVVSEAMHALGIPTSRALAAVATGEQVYRESGALPGAVLTRVAASHIRVGTFQYFSARRDTKALQALFEYTVKRHYPDVKTPTELLEAVIDRQARLVAQWIGVGFIHGVMNTDNTTVSGETIDYGPCAFMDTYHPNTVYSSIDSHGRYSYSNQAVVIVWNMAQFATSLVPLMENTEAAITDFTQLVHSMPDRIQSYRLQAFGEKLGIASATPQDEILISDLLDIMANGNADFTNTFRALGSDNVRERFANSSAFGDWEDRWRDRIQSEKSPQERMKRANPAIIPRNHKVEHMIQAAVAGDYQPFERLLSCLSKPYDDQPDSEDLLRPPQPSEVVQETFCGT